MKTFNFHVYPKSKESKTFRGVLLDVTLESEPPRFSRGFENESKKELWNDVVRYIGSLNVEIKLKCNNTEIIIGGSND